MRLVVGVEWIDHFGLHEFGVLPSFLEGRRFVRDEVPKPATVALTHIRGWLRRIASMEEDASDMAAFRFVPPPPHPAIIADQGMRDSLDAGGDNY